MKIYNIIQKRYNDANETDESLTEKLIKPQKGERKDSYVARFMSDKQSKKEFPDNKQRYAVCMSYWERKGLAEEYSDESKGKYTFITSRKRDELNDICKKYCGVRSTEEVSKLWDELSDAGIDPIPNTNEIMSVEEKIWFVPMYIGGEQVLNADLIFYKCRSEVTPLKCKYNIYISKNSM